MKNGKGIPVPKERGIEIIADKYIDDLSTVKSMINGDIAIISSRRANWETIKTNEKWREDNFYDFVDFVKLKSKQYLGGYDKDLVDLKDPVVDKIVSKDREYNGQVIVTFSATLQRADPMRRIN
jgi:hypothetical protein